ncbi:MAG: CTP synthase [bacterium]|nr:CTP synthase [bacterium]
MAAKKRTKYIFVAGGVMSSVGKGIATSSIAKILQSRGLSVTAIKIDPYVNVDAGTMNPTEHGEVVVLKDGMECDQDLGNYERFLNTDLSKLNYMTTGSVYLSVIAKERNLEYGGKCVSVVPGVPNEVIAKINKAVKAEKAEVVVVEIGGTVGEYQNILFLEAYRDLHFRNPGDTLFVLVSFLPLPKDGELKSKPTQFAVRTVNAAGIQPDIILARATVPLDKKRKEKIAFNCNLHINEVISAPDVASIYEVPINFEKEGLGDLIIQKLNLPAKKRDLNEWRAMVTRIKKATTTVRIGIVGKYFTTGDFTLSDSYISVLEAVKHAAGANKVKPEIIWLDAEEFEQNTNKLKELDQFNGIIVPGGFGSRGVEGKINVIEHCRKNKIPYLGLCYGMQLAVVEFARHVVGLSDANTTEIDPKTKNPVIDIMPEQKKNMADKNYGATMRLGDYPAIIKPGTIAAKAYQAKRVIERHRHRYEVNPSFISKIEKKGLVFSGISPDRRLMEIAELPTDKHPFFVGTQSHPELISRPLRPHPLFVAFIKAAVTKGLRNTK